MDLDGFKQINDPQGHQARPYRVLAEAAGGSPRSAVPASIMARIGATASEFAFGVTASTRRSGRLAGRHRFARVCVESHRASGAPFRPDRTHPSRRARVCGARSTKRERPALAWPRADSGRSRRQGGAATPSGSPNRLPPAPRPSGRARRPALGVGAAVARHRHLHQLGLLPGGEDGVADQARAATPGAGARAPAARAPRAGSCPWAPAISPRDLVVGERLGAGELDTSPVASSSPSSAAGRSGPRRPPRSAGRRPRPEPETGRSGSSASRLIRRHPGVVAVVDDRGGEHRGRKRRAAHRLLGEGLGAEEPGALELAGTERGEEHEAARRPAASAARRSRAVARPFSSSTRRAGWSRIAAARWITVSTPRSAWRRSRRPRGRPGRRARSAPRPARRPSATGIAHQARARASPRSSSNGRSAPPTVPCAPVADHPRNSSQRTRRQCRSDRKARGGPSRPDHPR